MLIPVDIRMVRHQLATPLGNANEFWSALLLGRSALKIEPEISRRFPVALIWNRENPVQTLVDLNYDQGLKHEDAFGSSSTLTCYSTTKGWTKPGYPVRPLWRKNDTFDGNWRMVSNACASGSVAVLESVEVLLDGEFQSSVTTASELLSPFIVDGFSSLHALSTSPAKPFDRNRDGLSLGEAAAMASLRRAADLEHPESFPRIISYGCSNDANHISGPSRDGSGLALAIERALEGIDKSEIRAICAHGTATEYNDAMEARAFHAVFNGKPPPVFGIKGAIGHTLGAAGLIEVIVSALVATEGLIPPTVGFEQGEEEYPLDVVHGEPRRIKPGYVLTTNSGFGGMNTAIVVGPGAA